MNEKEFTSELVDRLRPQIEGYVVETGKSLFYSLSIDEQGNVPLSLNKEDQPTRGGGTGFEQDILIYERVDGQTSIAPRVVAEVKFRGVTTHDALVYSEKAKRIRSIYPYMRYGMILGDMENIPPRVLRLGVEFDFILRVSNPASQGEFNTLMKILLDELDTSRKLGKVLTGTANVSIFWKRIDIVPPVELTTQDVIPTPAMLRKPKPISTGIPHGVSYYVYENWTAEDKARIHFGHCYCCNFGQGNHPGSSNRNGCWHGPFASFDKALEVANATGRQVSNCKGCTPN